MTMTRTLKIFRVIAPRLHPDLRKNPPKAVINLSPEMATIRVPSLRPFVPPSPSPSLACLPARSLPFQRCSTDSPLGAVSVRYLTLPPSAIRNYSRRRARSTFVFAALGKYADAELVSLPSDPGAPLEDPVKVPDGPGIYAVYDGDSVVQFIGVARNVAGNLAVHRKTVPSELCRSVKVGVLDESEPDRNALTEAWKSWMQEHIESTGKIPPGNETGNNTWVRRRQQKPDLRLTPGPHVQLTIPLEELIDRLVKENKVVAFIKGSRNAPQCGFSQRVIGILDSQGIDFESVDVLDEDHNKGLRETLKTYSNWPTFPQIFVKGELIGGCDILTAMAEKGELAQLFEK